MFDLHTHSYFSDGTLPPEKLIEGASEAGLELIALTDHDTLKGLPRARAEAERLGVPFLCGIELEAEYEDQLHILGLGVDPRDRGLCALIALQDARRTERNEAMFDLLERAGMDVRPFMKEARGAVTRANIARGMLEAGFVSSINEAFRSYLGRGKPFYVPQAHPGPEEVIDAIRRAGGVSVLAHPMNMAVDHRALFDELRACGLWGAEAYYGTADSETVEYFCALAREYRLRPTCGSDFHGANRPGTTLGCSWRDTAELSVSLRMLRARFGITGDSPLGRRRGVVSRGVTLNEYQLTADRIVSELPQEFFIGLNGGVVITERTKLHKKSRPERPLYILGEYHHGGGEGCYITLYYGSFMRTRGHLRGREVEDELRRIILHEFRHHLEIRAGEHDLEYEDEDRIDAYCAEYESPVPAGPQIRPANIAQPTSTTYKDPFDGDMR